MFGLVGFFGGLTNSDNKLNLLHRMMHRLTHRGHDDSGVWLDNEASIGLAHRRLAIVDLSPYRPLVSSRCLLAQDVM